MSESIPTARDPGDVLAGVPVMLGFYPSDSLVLVTLRDQPGEHARVVGVAARHDLLIEWDQLLDAIARAAAIAIRDDATAVLVLLIDSTTDEVTSRSRDSRHDHVVHSLASALTRRGITVDGAWATMRIAAGARWWSLLGPDRTGTVPDPETSALAAAYRRGRGEHAIRPSREHVAEQVRVNPVLVERVSEIFSAPTTPDPAAADEATPEQRRALIASMIERIDAVAVGAEPAPAEYANTATALRHHHVRDAMFGLPTTHRAQAAQQFWAVLTRCLPDPDRAEAATLLTFSAYLNGDSALAYVAVEAALRAHPDHAIAGLLNVALRTGMAPGQVRPIADRGHAIATEHGVSLHD
ncbi:DUF4192 domain-containing protein [Nocardia jiangxiensis]|uniref:DUF4192 domain-containing protein n=1 Tax=Nocardia jiangxiensis TaxID=282685 RepID=UPI0003030EE4|nr:DUF4192 domain-containing protein [Nocardia jiangxiensis]